jgi:uncharacterized protein (TIGR02145 family)
MKTTILFSLIVFLYSFGLAQNNAPEVTNVTFSQRIDGTFMVDVYYDLYDTDGDTMFVAMHVSANGGATWNFPCDSLIGDVGADILTGTGKHIVWDFGKEHPQTTGTKFMVQIVADDAGFESGTVTDIDGNVYPTVRIGNQWWMAENLKVTHYRNGDAIPNVTDNSEWTGLSTGAYASYDNADSNIATYGLLYNWYAVSDSSNIAPAGWHVPTDEEFTALEEYLIANGYNWDGTTSGNKIGKSLASKTGWKPSDEAGTVGNDMSTNNTSGFSALPGGYRHYNLGTFLHVGSTGYWWSSTEYSSTITWLRYLHYNYSGFYNIFWEKPYGFSMRLIRD